MTEREERLERIRASQAGVVQPDETILFLLAEIDRMADERDALASTIAEIRASLKDDRAVCEAIRRALQAAQTDDPETLTSHGAAKRAASGIVNLLDNIVLRHVEHDVGHDIKTLCQQVWKLRHGGPVGVDLDRRASGQQAKAYQNLERAHIRIRSERDAAIARADALSVARAELRAAIQAVADTAPGLSKVQGFDVDRIAVGYREWCALVALLSAESHVRGSALLEALAGLDRVERIREGLMAEATREKDWYRSIEAAEADCYQALEVLLAAYRAHSSGTAGAGEA